MSKKKAILEGHKRLGNRLIPPMLQIPNVTFTAFRNDMLPELVWMVPFFLRCNDLTAVNTIMDFLRVCTDATDDDTTSPLCFLSNFDKLSDEQKERIIIKFRNGYVQEEVLKQLNHQNSLFDDYPLKFIFTDHSKQIDKENAVKLLEEDVDPLLDRYSEIATKVQVTTIVSMMATGKLSIHQDINFPDPNSIFLDPASEEAKRVASFARASLNAGTGFDTENVEFKTWPKSFWKQAFKLSECR